MEKAMNFVVCNTRILWQTFTRCVQVVEIYLSIYLFPCIMPKTIYIYISINLCVCIYLFICLYIHVFIHLLLYIADFSQWTQWDNMEPLNDTWHPRLQDVVYYGMDWLCPGYNEVLHQQLQRYHGNLTAALAIEQVTSIVQTGNLRMGFLTLFIIM